MIYLPQYQATSSPAPTSSPDECSVFTMSTCDITDDNNLDLVHDVMVGTCQDMCSGNPECNWFTWYNVDGLKGTCWFLDHCSSQEPCSECVSGEHAIVTYIINFRTKLIVFQDQLKDLMLMIAYDGFKNFSRL